MITGLFEILAAILFVLSSGVLFSARFRQNSLLIVFAGLIAIASTYFVTEQLVSAVVISHISPSSNPPTTPPRPLPMPKESRSLLAEIVHATFGVTKDVSNWIMRKGTGDDTRNVSDETVLQIIIGIVVSIAFTLLGLMFGFVTRTIVGRLARHSP